MTVDRKSLSADCWEAIFRCLGDEDLKAVSLTCKDFLAYSSALKKRLKVVHPHIGMLCRHLNRFTHLKSIDLLHFKGDLVEAIREIACSGIQLEALSIYFPSIISLSEMNRPLFQENVCGLSELLSNLKACSFRNLLGDSQHEEIAIKCPNLEQLSLERYGLRDITSKGLELFASKFRFLKGIYLELGYVSDPFIVALSFHCVFLRHVTILNCGGACVTENGVAQLLHNRPNLETLSIDCCRVKDDSISVPRPSLVTIEDSISRANALTSLVLSGLSNTDKVLVAIAKAKLRLNNFGLISCSGLTVSGLLLVLSDQLTKLRIERASLTDEDMKLLLEGDVGKLTHIEINGCHITGSTLFLLSAKCPSLVDIRMIKTDLDGRVQNVPLSKNRKIQSLCLDGCYGMNGKLAKQLGRLFPNLKVLDLSDCYRVTTKRIQAILQICKHLTELNLSEFQETKMIEEDVYDSDSDSEFPELNLEVLNLSFSEIDDEGLAVIARKCPRLASLYLEDCNRITIEGIKQVVKNIKTLTYLNLVYYGEHKISALLEWMLSTGNLASLKRIVLSSQKKYVIEEYRDQFLQHGLLLTQVPWQII